MMELIIALGQIAPLYIEYYRKGAGINMKKLFELLYKGFEFITPREDL